MTETFNKFCTKVSFFTTECQNLCTGSVNPLLLIPSHLALPEEDEGGKDEGGKVEGAEVIVLREMSK